MDKRLRGITGLCINYTMLIVFGVIFAIGVDYLINYTVDIRLLIGTMLIVNTITMKHMRSYWVDLILGDRKQYSNHRPGFTNEILDGPKGTPKEETGTNTDLKRNPLDD